jgi:hypothetical protein
MRIGITAFLDETRFWHAGAPQHAYYLYKLIDRLGYDIVALTNDNNVPSGVKFERPSLEAYRKLDLLICFSFMPTHRERQQLFKETKMVLHSTYNEYCGDSATMIYGGVADCDYDINRDYFHEIWTLSHHALANDYLKVAYNTEKVFTVPFLYEREYLKKRCGGAIKIDTKDGLGVAVCEMNRVYSKNCLFPFATCARANKQNESLIKRADLYCVEGKMKDSYFFNSFHKTIKQWSGLESSLKPRTPLNEIFQNETNCLLSHVSDDWGLNYLYFDAMHLGIPLVHNSRFIKDFGYYYEGMDMDRAIDGLKEVKSSFDQSKYREVGADVLAKFSIRNPKTEREFVKRIENV